MVSRKKRTAVELKQVADHLRYEIDMLLYSAHELASSLPASSAANNALVEAFAIHARNVIDFFWRQSDTDDDVLAEDFFPDPDRWRTLRPAMPDLLQHAKRRANKQMAHLTYTRLLINPEEKGWKFIDITNHLQAVLQVFVREAPTETVQALTRERKREG